MRISRVLLASIAMLVGMASLVFAATDISGQWKGTSDQGPEFTFNFKMDGAKLTGSMLSTEGKELPIQDAKLDGDNISFSVNSEWQGQPIKLVAKGKIAGDAIQLNIGTDDGAWGTDVDLKRAPAAAGK
jgi:autotransporter translocation and assembly factor TamB